MNKNRLIWAIIASVAFMAAGSSYAQPPAAAVFDPVTINAKQQEVRRQTELINQLADKFRAEAAAEADGVFNALAWKRDFGGPLLYQSASALADALAAPSLATAQKALYSSSSSAKTRAKHSSNDNWAINFISTPCRILDTRSGGNGALQAGVWRTYTASASNAAIIAAQGGNAAGCGFFPKADGFMFYVTVIPPGAPLQGGANFLTVQHDPGATPPTTSTMNYYPGINIANFAISACNGCQDIGDGQFSVYASGSTHVVVDLLAWTGTLGPAELDCVHGEASGSFTVLPGGSNAGVSSFCAAGYTLTGGGCWSPTSPAGVIINGSTLGYAAAGNDGRWFCEASNPTASTQTVNIDAMCCRIPRLD